MRACGLELTEIGDKKAVVCAYACARACVCMCVHVCSGVCACACVYVRARVGWRLRREREITCNARLLSVASTSARFAQCLWASGESSKSARVAPSPPDLQMN